jgi:hypothetical protein
MSVWPVAVAVAVGVAITSKSERAAERDSGWRTPATPCIPRSDN